MANETANAPQRIQIKHRWSGRVLYECDIPEGVESGLALRHALERAVREGVNLSYSDLRGSNLSGSNLSDSDLRGSDLSGSNLSRSDLSYSNLSDSNLSDSNLSYSDLRGSDLSGSNLSRSDLSRSDLRGSNLGGANLGDADLSRSDLRGSNLGGANLGDADLGGAKNDFWEILLRAPNEIAGLRAALVEGRVDGSTYEGSCACLVGTIGNVRGVPYSEVGNGIVPNSGRPAERWFMGIRRGDKPETNQISAITVEWLDEFVSLLGAAAPAPTEAKP